MPPPHRQPSYIPSVRARRLAHSLRECRKQAGLGQDAVAARLGWSQGKVSHIEQGRNKPDLRDVELMLDMYGVTTPNREALLALARAAEHRGWWTDYIDVLNGPYVALEDDAEEIWEWQPQVVPGLLQTTDYAREIIRAGRPHDPSDLERRLRARVIRQNLLTREQNAPHLKVVLDEPVLLRPVGGRDVMRDQLYRLKAAASRPNITIKILPLEIGTHAGLEGSTIVLRFAEPGDPDVAYSEGFFGAVYLESPSQVSRCTVAFEELWKAALDPARSAARIGEAAHR